MGSCSSSKKDNHTLIQRSQLNSPKSHMNSPSNLHSGPISRINSGTSLHRMTVGNKTLASTLTRDKSQRRVQQFQVIENHTNLSKSYTLIDVGFSNEANVKSKFVTVQHNLTGKVRFCRTLPWNGSDKPAYVDWVIDTNLHHPNIQFVYEIYSDKQNYYMLEDYCSGGSLQKVFKMHSGHIPENFLAQIVKGMLQSIQYLHSKKLTHQNLTIDSFLLHSEANDKIIKLADLQPLFEKPKKTERTMMFASPEYVKKKPVSNAADIWSIGMIMYYLVTGEYAVKRDGISEIKRALIRGQINLEVHAIEKMAGPGRELLTKMLNIDPSRRPSAQECLKSAYFDQTYKEKEKKLQVFSNLDKITKITKLQACILLFMANHYLSNQMKILADIFNEIDQNKDQTLTKQELVNIYSKLYEDKTEICDSVNAMFPNIDMDGDGEIDLEEFIIATIDRHALLTKAKLEETFKIIDKDHNGKISVKEMQIVSNLNSVVIQELFRQVDVNGDGQLSFQEFQQMMLSML